MKTQRKNALLIYFLHVFLLGSKRLILLIRNWKTTAAQILSPIFIVLLLLGFQSLSNYVLGRDVPYPSETPLSPLPPCTERNGVPCTTVLYCPNVTWVTDILQRVAIKNQLDFYQHFKLYDKCLLTPDPWIDFGAFYFHFLEYQNTTQNGIFFTPAYNASYRNTMPSDPGYILFYNSTNTEDYLKPIIKSLNEAILDIKMGINSSRIDFTTSPFPSRFRIAVYDVVASNGAIWFYLPPMVTFFIILTEIVFEKEKRLRIGMRMMGLSNSAYWTVWWLTGLSISILTTLILIAAGAAAQFTFFLKANQFSIFLLFVFFTMGMTSFAMFLSTLISKSETSQTVGYALILVVLFFK